MTTQHQLNRSARLTGREDQRDTVRFHGSWLGETRVALKEEPYIDEPHIAIYDAEDYPRERIYVVTGEKLLHIRHAILTWCATRGVSIV